MTTKTIQKSKPRTTGKKKVSTKRKVNVESIRIRAQEIYQSRLTTGKSGDELSDWLEAEKILRS